MPDTSKSIKLLGRILMRFAIKLDSGLHIGGSEAGIEIGGVDKTVIRDPLTNQPYIPGSSLRGKVRSLLEKRLGLPQNERIGTGYIHSAQTAAEYAASPVSQVFGVAGKGDFGLPSRLVVRDIALSKDSRDALLRLGTTDLPFTEVKTEVSIDRVTSAANPRQLERVPAGVIFGGDEGMPDVFVYSVYDGAEINANPKQDLDLFSLLIQGMQLIEDDYLGGFGSRGSGKISFHDFRLATRAGEAYTRSVLGDAQGYATLVALAAALPELKAEAGTRFGLI
jgi:CRISPR-associated protein Csm3